MPRERSESFAQRPPATARSIVASGQNISDRARKGKAVSTDIKKQSWQSQAWRFYDVIGEYRYACNWIGNLTSKATLYVEKDGKPTTDAKATAAMEGLYGGPEDQVDMLQKIGTHLTVAGDCYVVGIAKATGDEWDIYSSNLIRTDGSTFTIDKTVYPASDVTVIRIWEAHPRDPKEANSPSRAVLPVLGELEGLGMRAAAEIDSRLTSAGILLIPDEMSLPKTPVTNGDETDGTMAEGFSAMLVDAFATALEDRASAEALVPFVVQGSGEFLDKVRHLTFWSELDAESINLRTEAIRRISFGMDMPPESLTGTADMNHWNAWQLEEAAIKAHTEPFLARIALSLTRGYLRPYLISEGMEPTEAARYSIGVDTAALRLRPNRSKEAQELYDRGAISLDTMLTENGFDPKNDKMGAEELKDWFARKVASGSTTPDLVAQALEYVGLPFEVAAEPDGTQEARPTPSLEEHPTRAPELPDDPAIAASAARCPDLLAYEVLMYRALERAGNKLKTKMRGQVPTGVAAADLYQFVQVEARELDGLLEDAWSCVDRFDSKLPIDKLDEYARSLIMSRKPHDAELMQAYLTITKGI